MDRSPENIDEIECRHVVGETLRSLLPARKRLQTAALVGGHQRHDQAHRTGVQLLKRQAGLLQRVFEKDDLLC